MKKIIFHLLIAVTSLAPLVVHAEFKCQGKYIDGFSKFDVLRYCGNPIMKDSYLKSGKSKGGKAKNKIAWKTVQQWYYTRTYRNVSYSVEFENGKVVRIIKGTASP